MSRLARLAEVLLWQREPEAEKFWLPMPLDLDEDEKEIFLQYWFAAELLYKDWAA